MDFEKEYYEFEEFWGGEVLQDEANKARIDLTINSIPGDVESVADIGCGNGGRYFQYPLTKQII
jgi:hypothetical protein